MCILCTYITHWRSGSSWLAVDLKLIESRTCHLGFTTVWLQRGIATEEQNSTKRFCTLTASRRFFEPVGEVVGLLSRPGRFSSVHEDNPERTKNVYCRKGLWTRLPHAKLGEKLSQFPNVLLTFSNGSRPRIVWLIWFIPHEAWRMPHKRVKTPQAAAWGGLLRDEVSPRNKYDE